MPAIRVLVVDDHPALRAGLTGLLGQEEGIETLGAVAGEGELAAALTRVRPDVVVLDYALRDGDGLSVCFRIKQLPNPPAVVLYSAYADRVFAVPATLAQADAVVPKSAPVDELLEAITRVAAGGTALPALERDAMEAASARLAPEDLPIAGMLFARLEVDEIAQTLGIGPDEVRHRAQGIVAGLQSRDRAAAA